MEISLNCEYEIIIIGTTVVAVCSRETLTHRNKNNVHQAETKKELQSISAKVIRGNMRVLKMQTGKFNSTCPIKYGSVSHYNGNETLYNFYYFVNKPEQIIIL